RTRLMRVAGSRLREVLNKLPHVSEILLAAAQERRRLLSAAGVLGLKVVGPGKCRDTMLVREFLFKNFVPFTWYDSASEQGKRLMAHWGSPRKSPVVECGGGTLLINPGLRDRLGPGGQAGGSSKIENFIGFPNGLSGAELATRSVLQMLKFGATMVAPVTVERIEPAANAGEFHALHLDCGTTLRARAVLI